MLETRPRAHRSVLIAIEKSGSGPDWVSLRVADNGRGITEERVGGRGLINHA